MKGTISRAKVWKERMNEGAACEAHGACARWSAARIGRDPANPYYAGGEDRARISCYRIMRAVPDGVDELQLGGTDESL